jgi:hypothetical protein
VEIEPADFTNKKGGRSRPHALGWVYSMTRFSWSPSWLSWQHQFKQALVELDLCVDG